MAIDREAWDGAHPRGSGGADPAASRDQPRHPRPPGAGVPRASGVRPPRRRARSGRLHRRARRRGAADGVPGRAFSGGRARPDHRDPGRVRRAPGIGHACGHNVIASSALGAGLALAQAGVPFPGTLLVIGTPAEEGGGGKILLAEAGVFEDVDVAYMLHPSQTNMVKRGSLANSRVEIVFHGRAAHAAGAPDLGINALEAVIQTFVGLNARRLHMRDDARVHGIITDGGKAVNIIPDRAAARFSVRARDRAYQRRLIEMVRQCGRGRRRSATGATLEFDRDARLRATWSPTRPSRTSSAKHLDGDRAERRRAAPGPADGLDRHGRHQPDHAGRPRLPLDLRRAPSRTTPSSSRRRPARRTATRRWSTARWRWRRRRPTASPTRPWWSRRRPSSRSSSRRGEVAG